jgi:hypothetical protein
MKRHILFFGFLGALLLASCTVGTSSSDFSPQIGWTANPTLNGVTITKVDTLVVGDTLVLPLSFTGVSNPLVSVQITNDTAYSAVSYPGIASLGSIILNNGKTSVADGYFYLGGLNISTIYMNVQYVPKKPTAGSKLSFVVNSTSSYSPFSTSLTFIAKAKK